MRKEGNEMKRGKIKSICLMIMCGIMILAGNGCNKEESVEKEPIKIEVPSIVRVDGTIDLMEEAVKKSGYAETGLSGLKSYGYGEGKFSDYLEMQASPLKSAEYVLEIQKWARFATDGAGIAEFYKKVTKETGFRADIEEEYTQTEKLEEALKAVYEAAGEEYPEEEVEKAVKKVSGKAREPLAKWLSAAAEAYKIISNQTKDIKSVDFYLAAAYTYVCCAEGNTQPLERIKSLAEKVSEEEMMKAGGILISATAQLASELGKIGKVTNADEKMVISTPIGNVVLGSTGADEYESPEALLLVDPAGDDEYNGQIAVSTSVTKCISVALDIKGNDNYNAGNNASQGCGILGVGALFDLQGDDKYTAVRLSQGCSLVGVGMLFDGEGKDSYICEVTGQAAGFYGTAILADVSGNDSYNGYGFVQGSAGNRCVAYLVDGEGNDTYYTPLTTPAGYERLDYGGDHAGKNGGFSQGCGWGQRNITDDGIAGGIAGMLDFGGKDTYNGGLWVQGTGYWSGIGFVYNEGGDDQYNAYYYSQASVAHYGAGILLDITGNDTYDLSRGAGMSFVWDRGISMFVDDSGSDKYMCKGSQGGVANSAYDEKGVENQDMTYAFFIEAGGIDMYFPSGSTEIMGFGRGGYFIDADGADAYISQSIEKSGNDMDVFAKEWQKGGVFVDASQNKEKVPYIKFWEDAKAAAGFGEIKQETANIGN